MQIHARKRKIRAALGILLAILGIASIATQVQARPAKPAKPPQSAPVEKDSIVLMPLRLSGADKVMKASMEAALVNGLQQKYTVISGEAVEKGVKEIFTKESAKKDCNADLCYVEISVKFKVGLIAIAEVNKIEGGYLLALSIKDVVTNEVKSQPSSCENCNSFQVIEKLKELSAMMAPAPVQATQAVVAAPVEVPQPKINLNDAEGAQWEEIQKGNSREEYEAYIAQYPKGRYVVRAKLLIKKLKDQEAAEAQQQKEQAAAERAQQDQRAWDTANSTASEESYQTYLTQFPQGSYTHLATTRLAKLKKEAALQASQEAAKARAEAANQARLDREAALAEAKQKQDASRPSPQPETTPNPRTTNNTEVSSVIPPPMNTNDTTLLFRVNGIAVPQARLALRVNNAVQTNKQTDSPELRKSIRDDLINLEVLSQNARNSRLDMRAEIAQQLILSTQSVLASTFVQNYTKQHPIPEKALTQEYEALKTRVGSKEFKIAHILVATESEANVILANLKKGSKFERIAKEKSSDPGSKEKGGDLGWAIPSNFVQPFSDAVLNMKKGQISAPVQTQYGWHIIKLDDIRELKVPAFIEVKSNIEKRLEQTAIQDLIKSLRANASVAMGSQTTVNGVSIPQARLELQVKTALQAGQADTAELRKTTLDQLINYELISQESLKLGLNKTTEVSQQIEIAKQSVLAQAFVQDDLKSHPIAEATLLQEYENLKNASAGKKEYKVAHILVETEKEAKAIAASVKNATFSKFAKEKSKDPGSKEQGGELGWTNPSQFVQPFGEAIVKLNKGQISAPVQTQYGWHVIKLDDVRDVTIPPFVEVKANLEKRLQQQAIQDAIKSLRANAKID